MRAKRWQEGVLIAILLISILWLLSLIFSLSRKAEVAVQEAQDAKQQYKTLEERKVTLEANLATLATKHGQSAAIRTAFGVARPGEEVIVVVPPVTTTPTATPSWWQEILSWF